MVKSLVLILVFLLCAVAPLHAGEPQDTGKAAAEFDEAGFKELLHAPDAKVIKHEMTGGLWQVLYEVRDGQRNVLYVTPRFDMVIYGQAISKDGKNLTRDFMLRNAVKVDISGIPARDAAFIMGNKEAKNRIFVFDDLECPFCARLHFELKAFLAEHTDYAVYVMLFPLPGHGKAEQKSNIVHCLGENLFAKQATVEKFFTDLLENRQGDTLPEVNCDTSGLARIKQYGTSVLKIQGTPVIVLPDGRVLQGFVTKKELEDILSLKPQEPAQKGGKL